MDFAAILKLIFPLISQFLSGKSGNDLASMITGNQDQISQILAGLLQNGNISIPNNSGSTDNASNMLTSLMPLLMKQQPLVIVPKGQDMVIADMPASQTEPAEMAALRAELAASEERIAALEKFVKIHS